MTSCDEVSSLIAARAFRELSTTERAVLDAHLAACRPCFDFCSDLARALEEALGLTEAAMHSTKVKVPGYEAAVILHNGDWSGDAHVRAWVKGDPDKSFTNLPPDLDVTLPAAVLLAVGEKSATEKFRSDAISFLESWEAKRQ